MENIYYIVDLEVINGDRTNAIRAGTEANCIKEAAESLSNVSDIIVVFVKYHGSEMDRYMNIVKQYDTSELTQAERKLFYKECKAYISWAVGYDIRPKLIEGTIDDIIDQYENKHKQYFNNEFTIVRLISNQINGDD